jgi:HK97 family phage prohead protease
VTMVTQAVWFRTKKWSEDAAHQWAEEHSFIHSVVRYREERNQKTHIIFPQFDTSEVVEGSWRTLADDFPDGISVTICERKKSMEIKHIKGAQDENDPFRFVMSDESVDRVGDVIRAKGWDLEDFQKNPVALWGHDHAKPIGVWENVAVVGRKLIGNLRLAKKGTSPEIDTIRSLVEQRILKSVSVGFQPLEAVPLKNKSGLEYLSQKLHECSLVSVPANANALAIAKSFGADPAKVFGGVKPLTQCAAKATKETRAVLDDALENNARFWSKRK